MRVVMGQRSKPRSIIQDLGRRVASLRPRARTCNVAALSVSHPFTHLANMVKELARGIEAQGRSKAYHRR
jgi:hypothetical protein